MTAHQNLASASLEAAKQPATGNNEEQDSAFMHIVEAIWQYRIRFILPVLLLAVLSISLVFISKSRRTVDVYQYKIQFNFSGVENLKYPNGETFNIQDIIAPHVLDTVYENNISGKYDITAQSFRENFRISAYAPARDLIIARYDQILSGRPINFRENLNTRAQMEASLEAASRNAAIIRFANTRANLPGPVVESSLEEVLKTWIRYSVDKRGVLQLNVEVLEPTFLGENELTGLGEINSLRTLIHMHNKVAGYISRISELEGAGALTDAQTGKTLASMQSTLDIVKSRLVDVARSWTRKDERTGVTLPGMISANAFNVSSSAGLDPQVAYDLLLGRISDIRKNIEIIDNSAAGNVVSDPVTDLTSSDLENVISEIETFQIKPIRDAVLKSGTSKDPEAVVAYFEQRIREFERERQTTKALAAVIDQVDSRYQKSSSTTVVSGGAQDTPNLRETTIMPQFNDGFLDRLISMSSQAGDASFRQELARKSIELLEKTADIESRISGLKSDLELFQSGRSSTPSERSSVDEKVARDGIAALLKQLSGYLDVTVRIGRRIKNSTDLINVLKVDLGLDADDPRLSLGAFIRSDDIEKIDYKDILHPLRDTVDVANRLNAELSKALYGARSLASSVDEPKKVAQSLFDRRSLFMLIGTIFLGAFIGFLLVASKIFRSGVWKGIPPKQYQG